MYYSRGKRPRSPEETEYEKRKTLRTTNVHERVQPESEPLAAVLEEPVLKDNADAAVDGQPPIAPQAQVEMEKEPIASKRHIIKVKIRSCLCRWYDICRPLCITCK